VAEPTPALMLSNMFDPAEEAAQSGAGWDRELAQDVREECDAIGRTLHLEVDTAHASGRIFVCFEAAEAAARARERMAGRHFGGRVVAAAHVALEDYVARFPAVVQAAAAAQAAELAVAPAARVQAHEAAAAATAAAGAATHAAAAPQEEASATFAAPGSASE
jgi:hypothetical protein